MEFMKLDSNFQPQLMVEEYNSLIWSERYATAGDFELHTERISETLAELPLGSKVAIRESTVPMVVESHKISVPSGEGPNLVVTGRSFEAYALEKRVSSRTLNYTTSPNGWVKDSWVINSTPSDAAFQAMRIVIGDGQKMRGGVTYLGATSPAVSPYDAIPEIDFVLPADFNEGTVVQSEIPLGKLYQTVIDLINVNFHGIKSIRPLDATVQKVGIEIYNGRDLTNYTVFDIRLDMFADASYLMSILDSANVAYVYGSDTAEQVLKTAAAEPSGLDRNVILVDSSSDNSSNTSIVRQTRGLVELYNHNNISLFDGTILDNLGSRYNTSPSLGGYSLGDIIKLAGDYGLYQNARVVEFIRSEGPDGSRSYPTLEALPQEG